MDGIFKGKKALIIGGSGGIGAAIAEALGKAGADLLVHGGHSESRLTRTLEKVRAAGGSARGLLLPLEEFDINKNIGILMEQCPHPDIVVFAWGAFCQKPLEETGVENWLEMGISNLILPGALVSSVLPYMIKNRWGKILLLGGTKTQNIRGYTSTAAYSAAKSGLGVLAESVAKSAGKFNISCNVLCPGFVDTEYLSSESRAYALSRSPARKLLSCEEIAKSAMHLLQEDSINGISLAVDGGLSL